ncbi:hypothetical protein F4V72_09475 [Salmonella enterica subsp. diarizonae]|uniref:Uncharacterized protein n=1 Tax=Salmonella diarizonae TaxID=59204 RepID=A0A379U447_SALDZ|nr:hypothetical protein [Salmonella enterica]ECH9337944.1 hypothetical protein [Salmonella enterica subsp. diarizonae]EDU9902341.1 hypothetical protein [Salmonella enterica subsp. diarizonae]KAA8690224.1 hypothetical protein F4V72_09475 [Salmonella enterica subsp. diarizonae]SUG57314.1 Uncharacterised protein [Salmonella enterica subsp. diarizonae]VFS79704.1 Uncharacterised protein [Salmonella enterica subsp. diarizonae]
MRIPYHPLIHQTVELPGDDNLTDEERQEMREIAVLLFSRVVRLTVGGFSLIFFFCVTLLIFG